MRLTVGGERSLVRRGRRWRLVLPIECSGGWAWEGRRGGRLRAGERADGRLVIQRKRWQSRWHLQRGGNLKNMTKIEKPHWRNCCCTHDSGTMSLKIVIITSVSSLLAVWTTATTKILTARNAHATPWKISRINIINTTRKRNLFKDLQSIEILARILIHLPYYFKDFEVKNFSHFIDQTMNLSIKMKTAEKISVCMINIWASFWFDKPQTGFSSS